ncbi:MAG TPA: cytochrome c maturation protein CcmE [Bacteroidia bacterium]|jgi:cytochrome c-type biogenesis protein CcmE|nr:cytochrome c maturation protein CcmE [Bacteroidia bacterium]
MRKDHIIIIVVVAVAIGAIIALLLPGGSTYADFKQAANNPDTEFHVVGKRDKDKPTEYNPAVNTDEFTFYLVDNNGEERKVVLHKNKPQDFERAEQIVLIGKMQGAEFHAKDILMKCPSKYNNEKPEATAEKKG